MCLALPADTAPAPAVSVGPRSDLHAEVARLLRELPGLPDDATDAELERAVLDRIRAPARIGTDTPERRVDRPPSYGADAPAELRRAETMVDSGDLDGAIAALLAWIDAHPDDVLARPLLRWTAVRRQGTGGTGALATTWVRFRLARACARNDPAAMLRGCERALACDPADVPVMLVAAAAALAAGHRAAAVWLAHDALAVRPNDPRAIAAAIAADRAAGRLDSALELAERLVRLAPDDVHARRPADALALERTRPARRAAEPTGPARPAGRPVAAPVLDFLEAERATPPQPRSVAARGAARRGASKSREAEAPPPRAEPARAVAAPMARLPDRDPVRFERWIADDAGRPGPVERVLGQSRWVLRALRAFVGLRLVALSALADVAVDAATSYARGILAAWLAMRTVHRRLARRGREAHALASDLAIARGQLWRLLRFRAEGAPAELAVHAPGQLDLEVVFAARAHLDQMSRDLALLTPRAATDTARKTIVALALSLVPNPFELTRALRDWLVLAFALRYDRRAVEAAYADLLAAARQLIRLAQREAPDAPFDAALLALHPAERLLLGDHGLPAEPDDAGAIEPWIAQAESRLQRLIAVLFAPHRAIDPACWSRADQIRELRHAAQRGLALHPPLEHEAERWLVRLVARRWAEHGDDPDPVERALRLAEARERCRRHRAARAMLRTLA